MASLALMLRAVDALGGRVPAGSRLRSRRHHRRRPGNLSTWSRWCQAGRANHRCLTFSCEILQAYYELLVSAAARLTNSCEGENGVEFVGSRRAGG